MRTDENEQLYELHELRCGEQIWMYSDTLHKMYHLADMYGYNIAKRTDFETVKKMVQ